MDRRHRDFEQAREEYERAHQAVLDLDYTGPAKEESKPTEE